MEKTKFLCFIGKSVGDECNDNPVRGREVSTCKFEKCDEDIGSHLENLDIGLHKEYYENCPNTNEQWLIQNRVNLVIPGNEVVCGKHRSKYRVGYKPSDICQYPSHQLSTYKKKKSKSDFRLIQSRNRLEINLVHSSVSNKIILPIGSQWCSKCRIWLHKETMRCHKNIVDDSICFLCCATHLHTPKRKRLCVEDEPLPSTSWTPCSQSTIESKDSHEEFIPERSRKDLFNESMSNISKDWTPLRFQLRMSYSSTSKRTKVKLLQMANKAIDSVLDSIALNPGQVS